MGVGVSGGGELWVWRRRARGSTECWGRRRRLAWVLMEVAEMGCWTAGNRNQGGHSRVWVWVWGPGDCGKMFRGESNRILPKIGFDIMVV